MQTSSSTNWVSRIAKVLDWFGFTPHGVWFLIGCTVVLLIPVAIVYRVLVYGWRLAR